MARPKKKIDPEQVRKLAAMNCSYAEIASVLYCSHDILERRFASVIKDGRNQGCMSLKRKMFESAMGGNTTMMIWLSKQMLGYRDQPALSDDREETYQPLTSMRNDDGGDD